MTTCKTCRYATPAATEDKRLCNVGDITPPKEEDAGSTCPEAETPHFLTPFVRFARAADE